MLIGTKRSSSAEREDALMYLPRKGVTDYHREQVIFDENQPSKGLHLVVRGRVKITVPLDDGTQTVVDIVAADDFFGESALLAGSGCTKRALALDDSTGLMSWTRAEIEEQLERQPALGVALVQMLVGRNLEYEDRLRSLAVDKTPLRVVRSLLRFADRLGVRGDDGSFQVAPLTHQVIAEYVGTSREIVTFQMNQLRRKGYLRYSRKGIHVYADALREHIHHTDGQEERWPNKNKKEKTLAAGDRGF